MRRSSKVLLVACALALAVGAYFAFRPSGDTKTRRITIAQAGDFFLYAPLYVAADAGYFKDKNLEVEIVSTGGDEKTWAAVVGGSASFGLADPTFVAVSAERGQPGRVVATIVNGVPFWGITFRKDIAPIKSPEGLKGYRVATFPSPSTAFTLQKRMFLDGKLEPSIVEGAFGTLLPILHAGKADIALELEPNVSQATRSGAVVVYSLADRYGDFTITGLTTLPSTITDDGLLVSDVVCALERAMHLLHDSPQAALNILRHRFPEIDAAVAQEALQRALQGGIIPKHAATTEAAWDKAIQLRLDAGDIKSNRGFRTYVDNTAADSAAKNCR